MSSPDAPLILTLTLDEAAFSYFNDLRRQHFPPERNYLDAHLTLFHHLSGAQQQAIAELLAQRSQTQPRLTLHVTGLHFMGRGVAFTIDCPPLEALHRELQRVWRDDLTPQDQQRRRPHVTVQNKVAPDVARALHQQLTATFQPFDVVGTGLQLWAYRGGPWELLRTFPFGS